MIGELSNHKNKKLLIEKQKQKAKAKSKNLQPKT
jgi:hypothetical protein